MAKSQTATFTVVADTVPATINGGGGITDNITNTGAPGGLILKWHVIASDFPADWRSGGAFGICDNNTCYPNAGDTALWNGASGPAHFSVPYDYNQSRLFDLSLNYSTVALGTHYVTIAITDTAGAGYTKNITFIVTKAPTRVPVTGNSEEKTLLYPNPANNEVNVVYDANADVKNIAVYNVIGKVMTVYKVTGNSANLNIENIPSGIYFVRLFNSNSNVVATRKFIKQ
jgi:hypothetical protein